MNNKRVKTINVPVDALRSSGLGSRECVLLYDPVLKAYYATSISDVVTFVLQKQKNDLELLKKEADAKIAELEEKKAQLEEQQKKFIADTTKTIDALINLVKGGSK